MSDAREAMSEARSRRFFLVSSSLSGAAFLAGCRKGETAGPASGRAAPQTSAAEPEGEKGDGQQPETTATEDLMREHGVIRRAIIVYREAAMRLRGKPAAVPADALHRAAKLFRSFGEDYHERQLEEAHVFPALQQAGGPAASAVNVLVAQHNRGREITDYVMAVTTAAITAARAEPLASALEAFARMYDEHAAIEDTMVFPAWKKTMNEKQFDEIGDRFEEIEHKAFGKDGFEDAVNQITAIERALGLDLAQFTAPAPPKP